MYRIGLEAILGFKKEGNTLTIDPCVPAEWREFRIEYRHGRSRYSIVFSNPDEAEGGIVEATLDGNRLPSPNVTLVDDGREHTIGVRRIARRPTRARAGS